MLHISDILSREHLVVAQSPAVDPLDEAQHRSVCVGTVWHKQVAVLGRTNVTVVDHAEATDHNIFEPNRGGATHDPGEVRTKELVLEHGRPGWTQQAVKRPAARVSGRPGAAGPVS